MTFNEAIQELESRKAFLMQSCVECWDPAMEMALQALKRQQWIPVSERLPDHDECIKNNRLFNVSDGNRSYSEWFDYDRQKFGEHTMAGFRVDYAVIAWMPVPEPYEVDK